MTKAKETKKETAPKKEAAPKDIKNGVTRPGAGTKTGRVWEIADKISADTNAPAMRKPVLDEAVKQEINESTAATQYGKWRKYHGLVGTGRAAKTEEAAPAE